MKIEKTNFDGDWGDICPYCGKKQEKHKNIVGEHEGIRYEHRMPCDQEKNKIINDARVQARTIKLIIFFGWILIPLIIAAAGFASVLVGVILFVISIFKIVWKGIELYGSPEKWFPGYESKMEKERKMQHYHYHCEKNPDAFRKMLIENFKDESK